eukprot:2264417-Prymnesium_polylepis.1
MRPRTTRSCRRSFERPRRPCWQSSRQGARELPWTVRADHCSALIVDAPTWGLACVLIPV